MKSQPENPEFRKNPEHVHVSMQVTTFVVSSSHLLMFFGSQQV